MIISQRLILHHHIKVFTVVSHSKQERTENSTRARSHVFSSFCPGQVSFKSKKCSFNV